MTVTAPAGPADCVRTGPDPDGRRVAAYLESCDFPPAEAGPVDLAVSGGPDSVALMILARAAGLEGTVFHVDHGLRAGSEAEGPVVGAWASVLGFAFESRRVTVAPGPDVEARAREARYAALPQGVLTGHTMDDQAETVLLNLMRGAALDGLSGMRTGRAAVATPIGSIPAGAVADGSPRPGRPARTVRRPLLGLRRADTAELCRRSGISPLQDPTNSDPRFRRNRVRSEVLPLLCDVAGRDVVPLLARSAAVAAADVELLDRLAADLDPLDVKALRAAPAALAHRALRAWLRSPEAGATAELHPPSAAEVARVMEVVDGSRRACQISGGRRVSRRAGRLSVAVAEGSR